jgi:hypothetical protein
MRFLAERAPQPAPSLKSHAARLRDAMQMNAQTNLELGLLPRYDRSRTLYIQVQDICRERVTTVGAALFY